MSAVEQMISYFDLLFEQVSTIYRHNERIVALYFCFIQFFV